jgi:hypothetical protein
MKRVSNSRNIGDIEYVIESLSIGDGKRSWTAHGANCTRSRHRFSAEAYDFTIEVVELRMIKSGRLSWHVMIVTEWWRSAEANVDIRTTKWLKVLRGKASDVTAWMRRCRESKLQPVGAPSSLKTTTRLVEEQTGG